MDFATPNTTSSSPNTGAVLPEHNETLLTRDMLLTLLADLSQHILNIFQRPIRLVVHGGAAMLLHSGLYAQPGSRRRDTRDIDYIHRAFIEEWRQLGMSDAGERLQCCINATAVKFKLGKDWMNAHADIALPMANDTQGRRYDPIYTSSIMPNNVHLHTLYTSPGLVLVSVTPFWAVALKLVRYQKHDAADITAILRNGTRLNGVQWSAEILECWLKTECWAMGYANYPDWLKRDMRERIAHAVAQINENPGKPPPNSSRLSIEISPPEQHMPSHSHLHPVPFPQQSQNRPCSSLDLSSHNQHSMTFPETSHRRLGRPSSMTFFPPQNQCSGHHKPPPPPPPLNRTHSMPVPIPMPIPQHSHAHSHSHAISPQHSLSSSQNAGMPAITPAPPPVGLLMPPPFHVPQPSPTTVHHSHSHSRSHSQSHPHSHSQSHSGLMWPSVPASHQHGMNWAGQIFIAA